MKMKNLPPEEFFWEAYRLGNPLKHLIECKVCRGSFRSASELFPCNGCSLEMMCQQCSEDYMAAHVSFKTQKDFTTILYTVYYIILYDLNHVDLRINQS